MKVPSLATLHIFSHANVQVQLIDDVEDSSAALQPFLLVGLLANYNKFESHDSYHVRFADVDQNTIQKIARCVSMACDSLRDEYVLIQNDAPETWSIGGTLSYIGLGSLAGTKPSLSVPTEEEAKALFMNQ